MTKVVFLLVIKALIQRTTQPGRPFFLSISNSLIALTVSKAPEMSNDNKEATNFPEPQIVLI